MVHEEDLQWGSRSLLHQRKGDSHKEMHSKENQPAQDLWGCSWCTRHPWRLPAMALTTSLLTSGSHWEAARRAAKTPLSTAGYCRVLGGWQGFTKKHLFPWPWSSSLPETTNSMAREARKLLRDLCNVCNIRLQLVVQDSYPACNTQRFSCGFMWQSSSTDLSSRRCTSIFPGTRPQKAKGKAGPDVGRAISGSNRKSFHTVGDTLVLATQCHL